VEQEVGHQVDRANEREVQEDHPADREAVRRPQHALLVVLTPAQPVVRGRGDEKGGRRGRAEERYEEDLALSVRHVLEPVRERDGEEKREQDLNAGQHDAKLVQELDQLAVEAFLFALRLAHRRD
jgi:hypothetical protein